MEDQYPNVVIKHGSDSASKKLSLVTRVRNRRHHLIHTLPTWLQYDIDEIVIVDWNSSDGDLRQYVDYLDRSQVKLIGVPGQACFNRGAAWNVGILHARNEWVMCMDCDVRFIENPLAESMLNLTNSNNFYRVQADWNLDTNTSLRPNLYGLCIINKSQWGMAGGYLECLRYGWGWEDVDFFQRLRNAKLREVFLPFDPYEHIHHDDADRTAAHAETNKRVSVVQNAYVASQVSKIDLNIRFDGWSYDNRHATRLQSHVQSVTYKMAEEIVHKLAGSDCLKELAVLRNQSNRIEDVYSVVEEFSVKQREKGEQPTQKVPQIDKLTGKNGAVEAAEQPKPAAPERLAEDQNQNGVEKPSQTVTENADSSAAKKPSPRPKNRIKEIDIR